MISNVLSQLKAGLKYFDQATSVSAMSTKSDAIDELKVKVIEFQKCWKNSLIYWQIYAYNASQIPFCSFYLTQVKSYAEIKKSVDDRIGPEYSILNATYRGEFWLYRLPISFWHFPH